ncbi:alpha/beta hydrolase [Ornithinimicrobium panacihumi]|uniref:alpha/beta hydrolase n=1 Tax=Ornithinimicrobium panacihumi TaxID=2008449 RepID=UPI003F8A2D04
MAILPGAEPFTSPGTGDRARTGVLVVHGLTSTPQTVRPVFTHLADLGYAVSAPLLPGHGTTVADMGRTRYADWFGAVEAAAADLRGQVDRMVAVGLSLGGALVTELAATRPGQVDGLVLINPAFTATDPRLRALPLIKHVLPTLAGLGNDIRLQGGEQEICYDRLPLKAFHSFVSRWPHLQELAGQVRVPVLLLRSAHDKVVPALSSEVFLDRVGSSDVREVVLERSAHVATLDHDAAEVQRLTAEFVARIAGTDHHGQADD